MRTNQFLQCLLFVCVSLLSISFVQAQCTTGIQITSADGARTVYTCPGDGVDDIITFSHSENSAASEFVYVITDDNNIIIGIPPSDSQNFEGAGVGTCRVWGFSYTGDILASPGESVFSTFFSTGCWAISSTFLEVERAVPDGGTVAMPSGATSRTVCTTDGYDDSIVFTHESSSQAAYQYVITDDQNNILGLPGNSINAEGIPPGICRVWGLSYTGSLIANLGDNAAAVALSDGCFDLSDNFIEIIRTDVDGGTVSDVDGNTSTTTCTQDGVDDILMFAHESSSQANYAYFITDENNYVLGVPPSNSANFDGAPAGTCRVWGISYTGDLRIFAGDLATDKALSSDCFDLSSNFIEVVREDCSDMACDVPTPTIDTDGIDALSICAGDGQSDAFDVNVQNGTASDAWVITDAEGLILALPSSPPFDLEGAGSGVCLVWYANVGADFAGAAVGNNAFTDLTGCYALSNPITVDRTSMNGGEVTMPSGATTRYTCANDGVADMVMFTTTSSAMNYQYVITDENNNILGLPPANSLDFEGAGIGVCLVWGLAYEGTVTAMMGDNLMETVLADGCYALSSNFITVNRDEAFGGTVSTPDGETIVNIVVGDENDDIINFIHEDASNSNYTYMVTDDQNNILALPDGSSANFEGAPAGVCRVWGLAYTGTITAVAGDNAAEVALTDGCFSLSANFITVNRTNSLNDNPSDAIIINDVNNRGIKTTVYPNPAQDITTLQLNLETAPENNLVVEVVNLTGQVVLRQVQSASKGFNEYQINVANLDNGVYFINIHNAQGIYTQNRFLKVN